MKKAKKTAMTPKIIGRLELFTILILNSPDFGGIDIYLAIAASATVAV